MKVIDEGHDYLLDSYDDEKYAALRLTFMKREGPMYPGNVGSYPGTNCQEVIRALIDRVEYLQKQIDCEENELILIYLRGCLYYFERRAAKRHGRKLGRVKHIEDMATCPTCGHIRCEGHATKE